MQRIMILAEDHDPGRRSWSWQKNMFLLEQDDSAGKQRTTVQGPFRDHLGTIFGQMRKLISRRSWINLGSILLLEAGFYSNLCMAAKCRLPYGKQFSQKLVAARALELILSRLVTSSYAQGPPFHTPGVPPGLQK